MNITKAKFHTLSNGQRNLLVYFEGLDDPIIIKSIGKGRRSKNILKQSKFNMALEFADKFTGWMDGLCHVHEEE